jgi:hypothetical protein
MKIKSYVLIASFCGSVTTTYGQGTLSLDSSSMGQVYVTAGYNQDFAFPSPTVSLAYYNAVRVTFSAPAGYAWLVVPDMNPVQGGGNLYCSIAYGTPDAENGFDSVDCSFSFVPGMSNSVSGSFSGSQLWEHSFNIDGAFTFGGAVEFTALTMTLHYVPVPGWQEDGRLLDPFSHAHMEADIDSTPFLLAIPEPDLAPFVAVGISMVIVMASGRRFRNRP